MSSSLEYLLEQINKYLTEPESVRQKLITSGRHFTGWLKGRIRYDQQVLINAIICPSGEMQNRLSTILFHIEQEFAETYSIKSLPFPYDELEKMKEVIEGLINHFDSTILAEDATQILGSPNRGDEKTGYIILTIINTPVIS